MTDNELSSKEIERRLHELNEQLKEGEHWSLTSGKLKKQFIFHDFNQAFGWMTQVAMVAEQINHHPEWRNEWNKVEINMMTHDINGITELDFLFITRIEALLQQ